MRAVNLLPPDRRTAKRHPAELDATRRKLLIGAGCAGGVLALGLSAMVWLSSTSVSSKQKKLDALQAQIATTPTAASLLSGMGSRQSTVAGLIGKRLAWDDFLGTLSKVMPEDVWLQTLQSTTPGAAVTLASAEAAAAAASAAATATTTTSSTGPAGVATPPPPPAVVPSTFTMTGYTYSQPSVARMMRRLGLVPWLSGVSLVSSTKSAIGADTVFQFTIKASVITPEATS